MTSEESVTFRKDWMTTRNRLVTTGETVDIQERLELGIKGRHPKMMTPYGVTHRTATTRHTKRYPQGLPRGGWKRDPIGRTQRNRHG
ncbi:hypothetical protein DPMN_145164 [Dreissena polymorpha]|uniref:Uncharacterized protein n=1 Tax=Dreissena polymorpha TaxID=45954 RepID=A0A9D4IYJ4_DREPO|nr:hypothetical protein DPMN_145164 [Dreissena polymorpha]